MLRKLERSTDIDFKEVFGKDHAESFLLLDSGRADALVADSQVLSSNIALSKSPKDYKILNVNLSVEPLAIMIRKDDIDFKKLADDTVIGLAKSGELGKLYDKWFMQPIPPKGIRVGLPASESTKAAWATPNDKPAEEYARR
jgi:glutamate/aspartate transport system substrate-binding protein